MTKNCTVCGKTFEGRKNRLICSKECWKAKFRTKEYAKEWYKKCFAKKNKVCQRCGILRLFPDKGYKFCRKCQIVGRLEHRLAKADAVQRMFREYKESQGCSKCGYNTYGGSLDFHHVDSKTKEGNVNGQHWFRNTEFFKKEVRKCILVCKNCHYEEHDRGL